MIRLKSDAQFMRLALRLARRGLGSTSPNPMVGAVLVKAGRVVGRGWHRRAGEAHAEIEALRDAREHGHNPKGATLYVTLEPCCTQGHTPPCTDAILAAGIRRVVAGTVDPNPRHAGRGLNILRRAGVVAEWLEALDAPGRRHRGRAHGSKSELQGLAQDCARLNEAFNHWIVRRTPFVTVKAAMTLDGKIATARGESKWITGEAARTWGMRLRARSDAMLVGINTILADDPTLTVRRPAGMASRPTKPIRRLVLDSLARTPLTAKVVSDEHAGLTTIVVSDRAPKRRVAALAERVNVLVAPRLSANPQRHSARNRRHGAGGRHIDLRWLLKKLGAQGITSLLVEGGGEVNASFLLGGFSHRVAFFLAPKILGGRAARKAVAGDGAGRLSEIIQLRELEWRRLGPDLLLTARVEPVAG